MNKFIFQKGPPIHLEIKTSTHHILQAKLKESSKFTVLISTNPSPQLTDAIMSWLVNYASGEFLSHQLPIDLISLTPFQKHVLEVMSQIPYGETWSYKKLAEQSNALNAARAVGTCCRLNPIPLILPCHRVVLSSGEVGEFLYGPTMKQLLLDYEKRHKKTTQIQEEMSGVFFKD